MELKLPQTEEHDELIYHAEITTLDYDKRDRFYRLRFNEKELDAKSETIKQLLKAAQQNYG